MGTVSVWIFDVSRISRLRGWTDAPDAQDSSRLCIHKKKMLLLDPSETLQYRIDKTSATLKV